MGKKVQNVIWVLVGLIVVVAIVTITMAVLFGGRYYSGGYGPFGMMAGYGFYGMGIIMPIIGVITIIFVLLFVYFVLEVFRGPENEDHPSRSSNAEDIAKERLAKGEITEDEYRRIIEALRR